TRAGFSTGSCRPTCDISTPPYMYWGDRRRIANAPDRATYGGTITVRTPDASRISQVVLVRNTAITHLTDGDQREVQLQVVGRTAHSLTLSIPDNASVLPPGPYMLFLNAGTAKGLVPSVSSEVFVEHTAAP